MILVSLLLLFFSGPATAAPDFLQFGWRKAVPEDCSRLYKEVYGLTARERAHYEESAGALFYVPRKVLPLEVDELNLKMLNELDREPVVQVKGTRRVDALTEPEMRNLFQEIRNSPQVKDTLADSQDRYNNSDRQGFSFARAVAAHLFALQTPLHKKSIRKVWGIGHLEMEGRELQYHATTVVRVQGDGWYALDPNFTEPLKIDDWYRRMRANHDPSKTMRLYSTPAKEFGPTAKGPYSKLRFEKAIYNNFFPDLLKTVRAHNRVKGELRDVQAERRAEKQWQAEWLQMMEGGFLGAGTVLGLYLLNSGKNPPPDEAPREEVPLY